MKKYILFSIILLIISIVACTSSNTYCDYSEKQYIKMKIINIEEKKYQDDDIVIWVEFNKTNLFSKPQMLNNYIDKKITKTYISEKKLSTKITLTGYISELKSGDCAKFILSFEQNLH